MTPKKFLDALIKLTLVIAIVVTLALGITAVLPDAHAQFVINRYPTPAVFTDYTGTNWIGFNSSAGFEIRKGTTTYTGATTNVYLTNIFALRIVDGAVVGIITP